MFGCTHRKFPKYMMLLLGVILAFSSFSLSTASAEDAEAPQNLVVVENSATATSVQLNWDNLDDLQIDVWNADTNDYMANLNIWNQTLTGLTPETTYQIYITWWERPATLAHKSNIVSFTTLAASGDEPALAPPTNLRIAKDPSTHEDLITPTSATIEWDYVDDFDNEIDIWNADTEDWITWGNLTTRTVGGLSPETTYRIYITWNKDRPSHDNKSEVIEFTTPVDNREYPDPPLTSPHNLRVTDITENSVQLGWSGSPGANGYDFYVNGAWTSGIWDGSNSVTFSVPANVTGAVYTFEVGAQNMPLVSANSNAVTLTWGSLATPRDLKVVTATRSVATLAWAPTPGALSYDIYRDNVKIATSDSNRYLATGLTEGQSYSFQVVAKNNLWTSPASDVVTVVPGANYNIVTYYTSWSVYARNFQPADIDVSRITHINYAFADLCWNAFGTTSTACQDEAIPLQKDYVFNGEIVLGDHGADITNLAKLAQIRDDNPHLSVLISLGGWSWSKNFSNMAATEETRRAFANSVVKFLRTYALDGLDIDWEYPVAGGESYNVHRPEDKQNFTLMMRTVREALDAAGSEDGKYYLLTVASGQGDDFVVNADLANASQYLDFINIMTYDYSGSWDVNAYHNAPLYYDKNNTSSTAARFNVNGGVTGHLNGGVPPYKLLLGLPFYGKGWTGCPSGGQYQLCSGESVPNFGTWENRTFDFSDVEDHYLNQDGYVRYWNEAAKVPYLYNSEKKTYISYNDQVSMMYSASYVKSMDLAGVMSWEISGDRNKTLSTQLAKDLPIEGTVNAGALAAPENVVALSNGSDYIRVKWDASAGATGYDVFANRIWVGYTTDAEFNINSLAPDTNYTLQIVAIEKTADEITGVSVASDGITVRTWEESSSDEPATPIGGAGGTGGPGIPDENDVPSNEPETPSAEPDTENHMQDADALLSDISAHWAHDAVARAIQLAFVSGNGDGTFRPNDAATRAEFAVMLSRALKLEAHGGELTFADLDRIPVWARPFVANVFNANIIAGYEDHTFRADHPILRAEMAVMIVRALGLEIDPNAELPFADAEQVPAWARPYVAAAYHAGLIKGEGNNFFHPDDNATRAEAVVLILAMLDYLQ